MIIERSEICRNAKDDSALSGWMSDKIQDKAGWIDWPGHIEANVQVTSIINSCHVDEQLDDMVKGLLWIFQGVFTQQ